MNYYDKIIDPLFKKIDNDTSIFYNAGKFSKGYIVDKDTEASIKKFLKLSFKYSMLIIVILVIVNKLLPLLFLVIYTPFFITRITQLLINSKKIE